MRTKDTCCYTRFMSGHFGVLILAIMASLITIATSQIGLCPAPNGDFPNPNSEQCTTFYRCIQGNAVLLRCPANQQFDFLFRLCRQQRLVNCNNQLQVFAAPAASPGLGGIAAGSGTFPGGAGGLLGLGALGGLAGGQLGAGFPEAGLITLLSQLGSGDGDGQNGSSNLATLLMMTALMNRRNSATQQQAPSAPAGTPSLYPSNIPSAAILPIGHTGNLGWQQALGTYALEGAGVYPGPGISLTDVRPFSQLSQQDPNQQRNAYPWNGAQTQSILFGQNGFQGQIPGAGISQPFLQNIVAAPAEGTDASDRRSQDSTNQSGSARNETRVTRRRRKNKN